MNPEKSNSCTENQHRRHGHNWVGAPIRERNETQRFSSGPFLGSHLDCIQHSHETKRIIIEDEVIPTPPQMPNYTGPNHL